MCDYLAIKKEKTIFYGQKYPGFWKDICYPAANLILQALLQLTPNIPPECVGLFALSVHSLSTLTMMNWISGDTLCA